MAEGSCCAQATAASVGLRFTSSGARCNAPAVGVGWVGRAVLVDGASRRSSGRACMIRGALQAKAREHANGSMAGGRLHGLLARSVARVARLYVDRHAEWFAGAGRWPVMHICRTRLDVSAVSRVVAGGSAAGGARRKAHVVCFDGRQGPIVCHDERVSWTQQAVAWPIPHDRLAALRGSHELPLSLVSIYKSPRMPKCSHAGVMFSSCDE